MAARTLIASVLISLLLSACNELLDIRPPADDLLVLDAAVGVDSQSVRDEDAGAEQ